MAKHTKITPSVATTVFERDGRKCIVCGDGRGLPNSHIVRRSQGGRGVVKNIVTHCLECHRKYDSYDKPTRAKTREYIIEKYPDWTEEEVTYHRYTKDGIKSDY